MGEVFFIDQNYIKYRRMWNEDRWKFSGELVRLTIEQRRNALTDEQQSIMDTMNRIISENHGDWLGDKIKKISKRRRVN